MLILKDVMIALWENETKRRWEKRKGKEEGKGVCSCGGATGNYRCSAQSVRSRAECCRGNWSKLIYRSAAHLEGCWLCFAKPKEWPRIRSFDWNKDGTEGSFLTLEKDGETNTFCLLAQEIAVNKGSLPRLCSYQPTPLRWQVWLG